jgi:hydrophobic/amphiphilic exporter-1 (mainly G- bacteria), HAE1 family
VIATSLVLIAVFVPASLFPGTTGRLYQQFALTIAFSIALSAFNALTLTPALSALLLKSAHRPKNRVFRSINWMIQHGTHRYSHALRHLNRAKYAIVAVFLVGLALTYFVYKRVPSAFVPNEDPGYFMVIVQAPDGASLAYTSRVCDTASAILAKQSEVVGVFSVPGFSFNGAAANRGIIFASMKGFDERHGDAHSTETVVNRVRMPMLGIGDAMVIPLLPPPIQGLGTFGGFQFQLQQKTSGTLEDLERVLFSVIQKGRTRPELQSLFTSFSAREPQYLVQIDREKAKTLNVPFTQISSALQIFMGSQYVNDFDFNNRSYRVYVQAAPQFRAQPRDLREFYVRSDDGQMISLDNLVTISETTTAPVISHYNLFRTAEINGAPSPGYSSGQALKAMEEVAQQTMPPGYGFEWTGIALEEVGAGAQSLFLFGLGLLVVYLTLSAQYESYVLPFIILLAVPMAILGALLAQSARGLSNDVYCQIGLLMLIGLASKNAILIVEFAEQLQARGMELVDAAVEAARLRLRPILMTSIAFILGVLPLVFASGAGSAGRHSVGTTVFGGMFISTFLNLFIIPVLYIIVRSIVPSKHQPRGEAPTEMEEPTPAPVGRLA